MSSTAEMFLKHAANIVSERRAQYGAATTAMAALAARWSVTLGQPVTPAQVVLCLIDLKLARLAHDPTHEDSVVDVCGYAAVLRELVATSTLEGK
ncbi:DUF6378 domain-containing protein [Hyphomonas sp.]|uniref:DUF6378 domain-containing protein n=1 Tax=Hyphomonas sp. TaxID=87 RepID=UPI0025BEE7F5|nr:DUF6378 domain-containing protein [Hyphomonas sp.]